MKSRVLCLPGRLEGRLGGARVGRTMMTLLKTTIDSVKVGKFNTL